MQTKTRLSLCYTCHTKDLVFIFNPEKATSICSSAWATTAERMFFQFCKVTNARCVYNGVSCLSKFHLFWLLPVCTIFYIYIMVFKICLFIRLYSYLQINPLIKSNPEFLWVVNSHWNVGFYRMQPTDSSRSFWQIFLLMCEIRKPSLCCVCTSWAVGCSFVKTILYG